MKTNQVTAEVQDYLIVAKNHHTGVPPFVSINMETQLPRTGNDYEFKTVEDAAAFFYDVHRVVQKLADDVAAKND